MDRLAMVPQTDTFSYVYNGYRKGSRIYIRNLEEWAEIGGIKYYLQRMTTVFDSSKHPSVTLTWSYNGLKYLAYGNNRPGWDFFGEVKDITPVSYFVPMR